MMDRCTTPYDPSSSSIFSNLHMCRKGYFAYSIKSIGKAFILLRLLQKNYTSRHNLNLTTLIPKKITSSHRKELVKLELNLGQTQ